MKLLLTNDDGIDAPGLTALEKALAPRGETVVVAPREALSGCSHQVNTQRPIQVVRLAEGRYAADGTPADCTRLGLRLIAPDTDWVIAGVNHGGNLGVDIYMSGTVAAVREAALLGKPGIAFSQFRRRKDYVDWQASEAMVGRVIHELWSLPIQRGTFWNVNLPDPADRADPPEIVFCPIDPSHLPVRYEVVEGRYAYRGVYQERPRSPGADVDVCFSGKIAVSRLSIVGDSGPR
jgi:5'-nucleotidase